jgi:hypothetical protein
MPPGIKWTGKYNPEFGSLLAMAVCQTPEMLNVPALSRASPLPQGSAGVHGMGERQKTCGSWGATIRLASEGGGSGDVDVECADAFTGKPAVEVLFPSSKIAQRTFH